MTELTIKLTGVDTLINRMKDLTPKLQKKGARRATRKAANVIRNAARAKAKLLDDPESAEKIWKNIVTQESGRAGKREGGIVMKVGVMGGARRGKKRKNTGLPGGDTKYWRHVEFGTEHSQAQPFMRPAISQNVNKVFDVLTTELNVEIDKLLPKTSV